MATHHHDSSHIDEAGNISVQIERLLDQAHKMEAPSSGQPEMEFVRMRDILYDAVDMTLWYTTKSVGLSFKRV